MSKTDKLSEEQVFKQELDDNELAAVSGGSQAALERCDLLAEAAENTYGTIDNCTQIWERDITGGDGFPNCAATVEENSFCNINDACYSDAVKYMEMKNCWKSWD